MVVQSQPVASVKETMLAVGFVTTILFVTTLAVDLLSVDVEVPLACMGGVSIALLWLVVMNAWSRKF